jgi:hypothetical protein
VRSAILGLIIAVELIATCSVAAPELPAPANWPMPSAVPESPGPAYAPPIVPEAAVAKEAPLLFEATADAGPDETFFAVGAGLTSELFVWGGSFRGPGQGQTRRVVRREGERLLLDRPWREPPAPGSVVAVGTGSYQNLIVGNYVPDGMTGIQLWISCIENVIAGNSVARQRRPALYLYASGTTLASSMPRSWNRGIAPLFFNHAEGNRSEECSAGALVTSGDAPGLPIEFPRALGNVLRHNSFVRNRTEGVALASRPIDAAQGDTSPSILGTLVEFNVVRDAPVAYHAGHGSDGMVFRRNHAYFWYPVNASSDPLVAFQVDTPKATVAIEQNNAEDKVGGEPDSIIRLKEAQK